MQSVLHLRSPIIWPGHKRCSPDRWSFGTRVKRVDEAGLESFAMNGMMMRIAVMGVATGLLPLALAAQTALDPNGNPQSPNNMSLPSGQPGMSNSVGGQTEPNQHGTLRGSLGAPGLTGQQMQDKQFLMKAAMGGIAEVQLGKLATVKGGPEVKEFGQKMVDDHTQMNKELGDVADEAGVMLPKKMSKEDQAEYDKLNGLSGDAFDKEYIAYMLKDHREDLHEFFIEAKATNDTDLQAAVLKAAGTIRQHLQMVTKLAQEKGVPVPPRPQRPAPPPSGL